MTRLIRFWKPYGVLTKFTDAEGRPTLKDYIHIPNVYAAGRLDMDSEGLLLLTNDARLAKRLTDPEFAHPRTYHVQVERVPDDDALQKLRDGVMIQGYTTRPARVQRLETPPNFPPRDLPPKYEKSRADRVDSAHAHGGQKPSGAPHDRRGGASHNTPCARGNWRNPAGWTRPR